MPRFRKKTLDAYALRRERSQNFSQFGNFWNPGGIDGSGPLNPFGPVLFTDAWGEAGAGLDLVANRDAIKWPTAAYLAGTAPAVHFTGAGTIATTGATVRMWSQTISYNVDKAHSLTIEGCGFGNTSASQTSLAIDCESDGVTVGAVAAGWNDDNTVAGANFSITVNGATVATPTGAQYFASAGATIVQQIGAWTGTNRTLKLFFNGTLVDSRTITLRGVNQKIRWVVGGGNGVSPPALTTGKITFRGHAT